MSKKALLELDGLKIELPVLNGTLGPSVLNIKDLYKTSGLFTYDPGFVSTASCSSSITFIDGEEGILKYRGHDVSGLADNYDFMHVIYLLLYGKIPTLNEHEEFSSQISRLSDISEHVLSIIEAFPTSAHPMSILIACFSSLAASYYTDHNNNVNAEDFSFGIYAIAQVPSMIAAIHRHTNAQNVLSSEDNTLNYSERFLSLMLDNNNKVFTNALDKIFILHADHEQNASTASVRLSGSAGSNIFACLAAGCATLWGPAHGGANEAVINMLKEIEEDGDVDKFIAMAKDGTDPFKLMGFGHRVYKNYDPRAYVLKEICREVLNKLKSNSKLLEIAVKLEEIVLKDEYFIERKLYPNVDFYSGIIMNAIGIPPKMFTPIFALARTTGWVSQWYELVNDKETKIYRPRQLYIGA